MAMSCIIAFSRAQSQALIIYVEIQISPKLSRWTAHFGTVSRMHARPSQVHLTKGVYRTKYFYKQNPSGGHCKQQLQRHLIASHLKTIIQCIADASMLRTCSHRGLFFLRCLTLLQFILQINSWLWAPIINTGQVPHNSEQLAARLIAIERWVEQLFLWMAQ